MINTPWPAWDKTFEVNLKGSFEVSRQAGRRLIDAGRPGSVIFVASVVGMVGAPFQGVYAMTKAAMISMTKTLAAEWGSSGIRVNAIAPGLVETRFAAALLQNPALKAWFTDRSPLGRHAQPEEITGLMVHLASDESSFTTGQVFPVDGGFTSA